MQAVTQSSKMRPFPRGMSGNRAHSLRATVSVKARPEDQERGRPARPVNPNKPKVGFFAPADTKAKVYAPGQLQRQKDFTKKGGRWDQEFIWNTNWQEQLKYEEDYKKQQAEEEAREKDEGGFLAISRLGDLNDPNVDLSEQFRIAKLKKEAEEKAKAERAKQRKAARPKMGSQLPARFENKRMQRQIKASQRAAAAVAPIEADNVELARAEEEERVQYEELVQELNKWTLGLTAFLFAATYAFYTRDIAASYGLGALGGYVYLRLLNKSTNFAQGGGGGPPRLLIPVIMVLALNRFNEYKADELNLHLELLPTLVGFFTYKAAVIAKNFTVLAREMIPEPGAAAAAAAAAAASEGGAVEDGESESDAGVREMQAGDEEVLKALKEAALMKKEAQFLSRDRSFRDRILRG